jgi:signal recognition particle receptor subunit beta
VQPFKRNEQTELTDIQLLSVRHLWQDYICDDNVSAILFVVDASDQTRWEEAGYELDAILASIAASSKSSHIQNPSGDDHNDTEACSTIPVAILLNKCDLPITEQYSTEKIGEQLDYRQLKQMHGDDHIRMFRISVFDGTGYDEAFQWISTYM